jgi:hypothetical protein
VRDIRDPEELGTTYLALRAGGAPIDIAVRAGANPYQDGGYISNDPAEHHSKTPQTLGDLNDGGEG